MRRTVRMQTQHPSSARHRRRALSWLTIPLCLFAVLPLATKLCADPADERLYEGRSLAAWRERLRDLDLDGPDAAAAVPGLTAIVRDSAAPAVARRQAALTLGRIGAPARSAVPVMVELLDEDAAGGQAEDRPAYWALKALALFGPDAAEAAPAIVRVARDPARPAAHRRAAVEALGRMGARHPAIVPALTETLALRPAGPSAEDAREAATLRALAAEALEQIGPAASAAMPALLRAVRDDDDTVRDRAAAALGALGPAAEPALPVLVELLALDPSPLVRDTAGTSLAAIGRPAVPALVHLLDDDEPDLRRRAASALAEIGPPARSATDVLTGRLRDESPPVRLAAAEALWRITAQAGPLLPALVDELTSPDRQHRMQAFRLLTGLGPEAHPAVPRLQKLLTDERQHVRRAAAEALRVIEAAEGD